jgi:hypothetical protein
VYGGLGLVFLEFINRIEAWLGKNGEKMEAVEV